MKDLTGKTWGSLTTKKQEELLKIALPVDGRAMEYQVKDTEDLIIDFKGQPFSIPGKIVDDEIIINDDATFYNPAK